MEVTLPRHIAIRNMTTNDLTNVTGTGWAFPPTFGTGGDSAGMAYGPEVIEQSLKVLLSTAQQERVMRPDYGSDLSRFMFEEMSYGNLVALQAHVEEAITKHEPRIQIDSIDIADDKDQQGVLLIRITYTILDTYTKRSMVYPFYTQADTQQPLA